MKRFVAVFLATLMVTLSAAPVMAVPPAHASADNASVQSDLSKVRQATAQYHDIDKAIADGFVQVSPYVPGMGYHYSNFGAIDPSAPNTLVYAEKPNGELKLVAVEWVSPTPFSAYGQDATLTPGVGYTLHAWVWYPNPDGIFASFNPRVP